MVAGNAMAFSRMLARSPSLGTAVLDVGASWEHAVPYFFDAIRHYLHMGDTRCTSRSGRTGTVT
jgi:hypothetical protein